MNFGDFNRITSLLPTNFFGVNRVGVGYRSERGASEKKERKRFSRVKEIVVTPIRVLRVKVEVK